MSVQELTLGYYWTMIYTGGLVAVIWIVVFKIKT